MSSSPFRLIFDVVYDLELCVVLDVALFSLFRLSGMFIVMNTVN